MNSKIDEVFEGIKSKEGPGLGVIVVKDGKKEYENYFGYANLDHNIKIDKKTIFDTGSLSKHFLGNGIGRLVTKGLIDLDDLVYNYFNEIEILSKDIKINHLLRHTSGLPNYSGFEFYMGEIRSERDVFKILKSQSNLHFVPGDDFRYCNTGYMLLAKIIENTTNQKFENWMNDTIFMKEKMFNTFVNRDYEEIIQHLSTPYKKVGNTYKKAYKKYIVGASAVHSTTEDLEKWLIYLDSLYLEDRTFFDLLFHKGKLNNGNEIFYGFGTFIGDYEGNKIIEHGGECEGYRSALSFSPDLRLGIAILSNDSSIDIWQQVREIYTMYSTRNNKRIHKKIEPKVSISSQWTDTSIYNFQGRYFIEPGAIIEIYKNKANLNWKIYGISGFDYPLKRIGVYTFTDQDGDPIEFVLNDSGQVTGVTLQWSSGLTTANIISETFDLEEYAGTYCCNKLNIIFQVNKDKDMLSVTSNTIGTKYFVPFEVDGFTGEDWWNNQLYFTRNKDSNVTGLKVIIRDEGVIVFNRL